MAAIKKPDELNVPSGAFVYQVYCHADGCKHMSPLVSSVRPCPKCGSSNVNIRRQPDEGGVEKSSAVPFFMQGLVLPDGANIVDLLRKMGIKKDQGMKKIPTAMGVSKDEMGQEF